jgi:proteasome assembly chaperone (PAC2) family protein
MSNLEVGEVPPLRSPVLVMAFGGWNDAGQSATTAVRSLIEGWSAQRFASIDPEEFFDFTSARPTVRLAPDLQRELEWPNNAFFYKADPALSRDFVLLLGTEPHLKWRAFTGAVLQLAQQCGVSQAMGLGALLSETPHSRSVPLTGFATDPELAAKLGELRVTPTRYEGPTGIVGTMHDACRREGLSAVSLWAAVPHYLGTTQNPKGAAGRFREGCGSRNRQQSGDRCLRPRAGAPVRRSVGGGSGGSGGGCRACWRRHSDRGTGRVSQRQARRRTTGLASSAKAWLCASPAPGVVAP